MNPKIVVTKNTAYVDDDMGRVSLGEFLKQKMGFSSRSVTYYQRQAGLDHPSGHLIVKDTGNSLKAFCSMVDVLGYDVALVKRSK